MKTAVLITIGDEILSGNTVDTNSNFIATQLKDIGIKVLSIFTIPDKEEACQLLMVAFDEAQLAPGWYESAGQVLKTCNLNITDDDILGKTCSANRWNGYESDRCTAFEKSRQ